MTDLKPITFNFTQSHINILNLIQGHFVMNQYHSLQRYLRRHVRPDALTIDIHGLRSDTGTIISPTPFPHYPYTLEFKVINPGQSGASIPVSVIDPIDNDPGAYMGNVSQMSGLSSVLISPTRAGQTPGTVTRSFGAKFFPYNLNIVVIKAHPKTGKEYVSLVESIPCMLVVNGQNQVEVFSDHFFPMSLNLQNLKHRIFNVYSCYPDSIMAAMFSPLDGSEFQAVIQKTIEETAKKGDLRCFGQYFPFTRNVTEYHYESGWPALGDGFNTFIESAHIDKLATMHESYKRLYDGKFEQVDIYHVDSDTIRMAIAAYEAKGELTPDEMNKVQNFKDMLGQRDHPWESLATKKPRVATNWQPAPPVYALVDDHDEDHDHDEDDDDDEETF